MAFLTSQALTSKLPADIDQLVVDSVLVEVESMLTKLGYVFEPIDKTSVQYIEPALGYDQSIFDINLCKKKDGVQFLTHIDKDKSENALVEGEDYVSSMNVEQTHIDHIRLISNCIRNEERLKVEALFGVYIDFDSTDIFVKQLINLIAGYAKHKAIVETNQSGERISEADTGDSQVKFDTKASQSMAMYNSFKFYPGVIELLNLSYV